MKNNIKNKSKKALKDFYVSLYKDKLDKIDNSSKLYLYSKLKTDFDQSDYLKLNNYNSRKLLTKFRISDHNLEVELGRYKKIPREQRTCKVCNILEDKFHFLLNCKINKDIRTNFLNKIININQNFNQLDSIEKIKYILNPDMNVLSIVVDFIKQSLELRK